MSYWWLLAIPAIAILLLWAWCEWEIWRAQRSSDVQTDSRRGLTSAGSSNRQRLIVGIVGIAWSLGVGWLAAHPKEPDPADLLPQAPTDWSGVKPGFTPDQMVWAIPQVKQWACVRAEMAVRYYLRPALVSFPTCGVGDKTEIDENLINVTVSGTATIGDVERPFTVVLEHYPSSLDMNGYIIISIDVGHRSPVTESDAR